MSYNGSGTFQINTTGQPVVTGTVISSSAFNALTADLATGLSTAITKDGQTATTARIPFAAGISSTLVTDSTSISTGSIITAGGAGIAKALYVGTTANVAGAVTLQSTLGVTGVATFSAAPIYSSLTASSAVATDASKGLVSVTNTGTGNNVLSASPTLTGTAGFANITASGTLGVTGVTTVQAGTAALPAITTTGDTNTGIFFPAADTIAFTEGGAEAMRIDSSGNLLVGTTNARAPLTVQTAPSNSGYGQIAAVSAAASDVGNAGISVTKYDNVTTTSQVFARFLVNLGVTASGQINANGASAAAFGSYSDRRLKENIVDLPSQLDNIMALRTVEFDYIESEGGGHQIGFVAQEVQAIYPDLVGERTDGMLTLTDLNKNDARLIKAIQELKAIVDTQASTITALTARITALETPAVTPPTGTQA